MNDPQRMCVLWAAALLSVTVDAAAQSLTIKEARAGECAVVVRLPDEGASIRRFSVDDGALDLTLKQQLGPVVKIPLRAPLQPGDKLKVVLESATEPPPAAEATVLPGITGAIVCGALQKKPADDRDILQLNGFLGVAIDNFAPSSLGGYPDSASSTRTRRTFGVMGQYRLIGDPGDDRQLWVVGATLNGYRTADIDCSDPEQISLCKGGKPDTSGAFTTNIQEAGIQVLEHASTLEAHIGLRYEFLTLQRESPIPAKAFVFYHYGFLDIANPVVTCKTTPDSACAAAAGQASGSTATLAGGPAPAFSAQYLGVGGLLPAGHFRDSAIIWGLADENIYGTSHRGFRRSKLNAVGFVDVLPQLGDYSVGKWLGFGSWRAFIALDVDRSTNGLGPSTIETYVGFAFDLSKVFHL